MMRISPLVPPAFTFVLIFILMASFLEKLIAAMATALLVKSPNRDGYCYADIFFQRVAQQSQARHPAFTFRVDLSHVSDLGAYGIRRALIVENRSQSAPMRPIASGRVKLNADHCASRMPRAVNRYDGGVRG